MAVAPLRRVLLVTGPAAAGKTTTTLAFASSRSAPCAVLDQDLVRTFVKAGHARADVDWGSEAERQWELSRWICLDAIRRYVDAGFDCVIDTYAPGNDQDHWRSAVPDGARFDTVVLLPALTVTTVRNRGEDRHVVDDGALVRNHEAFTYAPVPGAPVIDNASMTVDEVVTEIERLVDWPR